MAASIQVKGDLAVCSTLGTTEELKKIKNLSLQERLDRLEDCLYTYGVNSAEFYKLVKPLIVWTCYRHLLGMPFTEDVVNFAYIELIVAFEGGKTSYYNKEIYREPRYGTTDHENIGEFIMYIVGGAVSKYRSKNFKRQSEYEDKNTDITEKTNYTKFERENYLSYYLNEDIEFPQFRFFKFNKSLSQHLNMLKQLKPRNNILYNYMLWKAQTVGF